MEQDLLKIIRLINRLSLFAYWQPSGLQNREKIRSFQEDWRQAFIWFLSSYAFERQGRSPYYPIAAVNAVESYDKGFPDQDFEKKVWGKFSEEFLANNKGMNKKNNPLWRSGTLNTATNLIASFEKYDFNIVKWASSLAKSGDIETAWNELDKIRGIGRKIASLFLRDVVYAFDIDEDKVGQKIYLQPIDIWTQRGAEALAHFVSKSPESYFEFAEVLVEVSEYAGVRSTLINSGLWVFGAQIVRDPTQYHNLLLNAEELHRFLIDQIYWHKNRAKMFETVLDRVG